MRELGLPAGLRVAIERLAETRGVGVLETIVRLLTDSVQRVELARQHGRQGPAVRSARMSPEARQACARKAARARWDRRRAQEGMSRE